MSTTHSSTHPHPSTPWPRLRRSVGVRCLVAGLSDGRGARYGGPAVAQSAVNAANAAAHELPLAPCSPLKDPCAPTSSDPPCPDLTRFVGRFLRQDHTTTSRVDWTAE